MPVGNFGYSFAPTFDNQDTLRRGGRPGTLQQGQSPLQVLHYELPRAGGNRLGSFSPLAGQGLRGTGIGSAVLQSVLRTVLGPEAAAGLTGGGGGGGMTGGMTGGGGMADTSTIPGLNLGGGGELDLGALAGLLGGGGAGAAPAPTISAGDVGRNRRPPLQIPDFSGQGFNVPSPSPTGLPDYEYRFPFQQAPYTGEA
jgi:hypothetical protein